MTMVASFLLAMSCGAVSSWLFHIMRTEVNAQVQSSHIGPLGATPMTFFTVERLHRQLFPQSYLRFLLNGVIVVGFGASIVLAHALGVIG